MIFHGCVSLPEGNSKVGFGVLHLSFSGFPVKVKQAAEVFQATHYHRRQSGWKFSASLSFAIRQRKIANKNHMPYDMIH